MSAMYNKVKVLPPMELRLKGNYNMVKSFTFNRVSTWSLPLHMIWSKSATKDIVVLWREFYKTSRSTIIERIKHHKRITQLRGTRRTKRRNNSFYELKLEQHVMHLTQNSTPGRTPLWGASINKSLEWWAMKIFLLLINGGNSPNLDTWSLKFTRHINR
jgi:hypothetical protein